MGKHAAAVDHVRMSRTMLPSHTQLVTSWKALIPSFPPSAHIHTLHHNAYCVLQTADKEAGANCKNLSLHRGKATIKQRFQTGSVDELCFLGALSISFMTGPVLDAFCGVSKWLLWSCAI